MSNKLRLSQTKAARIDREVVRNAMYDHVHAQSHSERYLRGFILHGMDNRTPEESLELTINRIVTNGYDLFSTADGCPNDVSDVLRGHWKVKALVKFSEMAIKDPVMLAGYTATNAKRYFFNRKRNEMLRMVTEQIAQLLHVTVTSYCPIKNCDIREATGTELRTGIVTDKWTMVKDDSNGSFTGLLIRPVAKYRRRTKGTATIDGKLFMQKINDETNYLKLFKL